MFLRQKVRAFPAGAKPGGACQRPPAMSAAEGLPAAPAVDEPVEARQGPLPRLRKKDACTFLRQGLSGYVSMLLRDFS